MLYSPAGPLHCSATMFARIYTTIIVSLLIALGCNVALYRWVDSIRRPGYEDAVLGGVMQLVADSLPRQALQGQPERRERYLQIVAELLGAERVQVDLAGLPAATREKLALGDAVRIVVPDAGIRWCVPASAAHCTSFSVSGLSEQHFRAQALLFVAELSRQGGAVEIADLQQYSSFPLSRAALADLSLDAQQMSRLRNRSVVVSSASGEANRFSVYAPLQSGDLLQLGPIPRYQGLAFPLVVTMLILTGAMMALVCYWLVASVARRIALINLQMRRFGDGQLEVRIQTDGEDQLAELGWQFNRMAEKVQELLRAEQQMVQAVSHDFRTPLARMKFRLESIRETAGSDARLQQRIAGLGTDLVQMDDMVSGTLEHYGLRLRESLPLRPIQPHLYIGQIISDLQLLYPRTDVELQLLAVDSLPAHEQYFRRAVQNLVDNAFKHARHRIAIATESKDAVFLLRVEDDGEGVDEGERDNIFDMYYRAGSERSRRSGGYGIGLSIVRSIVDLHHGTIRVDRSRLGGAVFELALPLGSAQSRVPAPLHQEVSG